MDERRYGAETTAERDLRVLAERLLTPVNPFTDEPVQEQARLLVGMLPPGLAAPLPLPRGSRLLGSLLRQDGDAEDEEDNEYATVVLDAPLSAEVALTFFRHELPALGWHDAHDQEADDPDEEESGFVVQMTPEEPTQFRWDQDDIVVCIQAVDLGSGHADVRLTLSRAYQPTLQDARRHAHRRWRSHRDSPFPRIEAPPEATQEEGTTGWGGDSGHAEAWLETQLPLGAIADHYTGQLGKAGWACTVDRREAQVAWSRWRFERDGRRMRGLFSVTRQPWTEHGYQLQLVVEPVPLNKHRRAYFGSIGGMRNSLGTVLLDDDQEG